MLAIDPKQISAEKGAWTGFESQALEADMERFFGGNPLAVMIRLIIISIVAGIALKAVGFDPRDLLESIPRLIRAIFDFGFDWVETAVQYFLLGAVLVIPIWLVLRFIKFIVGDTGKGGSGSRS